MAKALIGYLDHDAGRRTRLAADNVRLRRRVADLEVLVQRLQSEVDALEAAQKSAQNQAQKQVQKSAQVSKRPAAELQPV